MDGWSTHGGARERAGRRSSLDKKEQVNVMIRGSVIDKLGGTDDRKQNKKKVQELILDLIDKHLGIMPTTSASDESYQSNH